jgi:transcriptional regulator with XRE-family HTH domain
MTTSLLNDTRTSSPGRSRMSETIAAVGTFATLSIGMTGGPTVPPVLFRAVDEGWTTSFRAIDTAPTDEDVRWIHEATRLSWQQIADALGVSRRSIHYWTNGGNISPPHQARIRALADIVRGRAEQGPAAVRAFLLRPGADGATPLEKFVSTREAPATSSPSAVDMMFASGDSGDANRGGSNPRSRTLKFQPQAD